MIDIITTHVIPATMALLPDKFDTPSARALVLAIGLQESRYRHRRQVKGPARGFWQFERGGVVGVLQHPATADLAREFAATLLYDAETSVIHEALEHNDILACGFARLLLWTLPDALPTHDSPINGWYQYLDAWRPGKPHQSTWNAFYAEGWSRAGVVNI